MPVRQAVLLNWWQEYQQVADEAFKWHLLPYHEAKESMPDSPAASDTSRMNPLLLMIPAVQRAAEVQVQMRQDLALLRAIEAIRMHAAEHGEVPAMLADVSPVPVPRDPATNEPFAYERAGGTFTIRAAPIASHRQPGRHLRITVTLD